jgi:Family of unknown function (DUF5681)
MSAKKKKAPAQHSAAPVGYGKPPVHSRFRKGQSGNPTGKRRHGEAERVQALIWEEAYRQLTVREGDKVMRMPAVQAVLRTQIASALKGNVSAQRAVFKLLQDSEAATRALSIVATANKKLKKDVNEITDEELEDILRAARNEKS